MKLEIKKFDEAERIFASFPYDAETIKIMRRIPGARWSASQREWHFALDSSLVELLFQQLKGVAIINDELVKEKLTQRSAKQDISDSPILPESTLQEINKFKEWMQQKRYSPRTVSNYLQILKRFLEHYSDVAITELTVEHVRRFNFDVIVKNQLSISFQKSLTGVLKLFFKLRLDSSMDTMKLEYPMRENRLPEVLSKKEVEGILKATSNLKHKAILAITYACGLRRNEVLNLKINDLDGESAKPLALAVTLSLQPEREITDIFL